MRILGKALLIGGLFFLNVTMAYSQQDAQFSQYFLNQALYNPAYCGMDQALSATAQFRSQWVGIDGHPLAQNILVHSPVPLLHGGLGIGLLNEQEGVMRTTFIKLNYSYIFKTRAGNFSLGVNGGAVQVNVDGSKLRAPEGDYQNGINHNDNILPVVPVNGFAPDFSAGLFFGGKNLSAGVSVNHIIPMTASLNSDGSSTLEFNFVRQYYVNLGYLARFSKTLSMHPVVLLKSDDSRFQAEADLIFTYRNFLWVGAGYRGYGNETMDALIGIIGVKIGDNFTLGYSYDYTTSALSSVSSGSHEVVLNYSVNLSKPVKPGKVIYTPRF
jgi:type IX secretion system PorP/SprF family membrane protein